MGQPSDFQKIEIHGILRLSRTQYEYLIGMFPVKLVLDWLILCVLHDFMVGWKRNFQQLQLLPTIW